MGNFRHSRSLARAHYRHNGCGRTTEFNPDKRILNHAKINSHMGDRYHRKYNPRVCEPRKFLFEITVEEDVIDTKKSGRLQISKASRKVGFISRFV